MGKRSMSNSPVGHTHTPRPLELLETFAAGGAEPGCQYAGFPVPFVYCQNRTDLTSARTLAYYLSIFCIKKNEKTKMHICETNQMKSTRNLGQM